MSQSNDARFMALALALGRRGLGRTWPNPAVGAVIVKDGVIVGRGWTQAGGRPHAEVEALRRAGAASDATLARRCTSRSSHARTTANRRPAPTRSSPPAYRGWCRRWRIPIPKWRERGTPGCGPPALPSMSGIGADEARHDHAGHILRFTEGRPHVLLKLAISADGKAAAAGRKPIAITGEAVRDRVHLLRAQSDAIMVGIGTALADDPMLTCRLPGMAKDSPVRVIADSMLRLPLQFAAGAERA